MRLSYRAPAACAPPAEVVFNGVTFRRYPDAKARFARVYYSAVHGARSRGFSTLHRAVWEFHNGPIPEGAHVHHIDEDPFNNEASNLECLTPKEHTRKHLTEERLEALRVHVATNMQPKSWEGAGREKHRQAAIRQGLGTRIRPNKEKVCV